MKIIKTTTIAILVLLSSMVNAQQDTLYFEDFGIPNGAPDSSGFKFVDIDGDGLSWEVEMSNVGLGFSDFNALHSLSFSSGPLTPDNLAISPSLFSGNLDSATVGFNVVPKNWGIYANDVYAAYLSPSSDTGYVRQNIDSLQLLIMDTLVEDTSRQDFGYEWKEFNISNFAKDNDSIVIESLSLAKFDMLNFAKDNDSIVIVFRHFNCTDMFGVTIDDILLLGKHADTTTNPDPDPNPDDTLNTSMKVNSKNIIYPNPFQNSINIEISENILNNVILITDLAGKTILVEKVTETINTINMDQMPKGIYLLTIKNETGVLHRTKIVKDK